MGLSHCLVGCDYHAKTQLHQSRLDLSGGGHNPELCLESQIPQQIHDAQRGTFEEG